MKKLLLIAALALSGSGAFAQTNQGRATDSPGHPSANAPASVQPNGARQGTTTGMGAGRTGSPNGSPGTPPKSTTGPNGMPSQDETPPR